MPLGIPAILRPNILLLLTDQQRFDTIQAMGSRFSARTPHMDSLAKAGIAFENAFCTAPVCSPSRATLMTGLFPDQAGMPGNLNSPCQPLATALPTIGKMMRAAGYETAYHGKWHLGGDLHEHGFEVAEECSHDETTQLMASRFWKDHDWCINDRPFFQVVSFLNPHDHYFYDPEHRVPGFARPWDNTNPGNDLPQVAQSRRADWPEEQWGSYFEFYSQLLERVDRNIGETLHQLRCSGFFSNTWIIFASDHGDMAGEHDLPFKGPYQYEGVVRVPLIIVPPQSRFSGPQTPGTFAHDLQPGKRAQLCSLIDIVPTVLDIAGINPNPELLGRSLLPVVRDAQASAPHKFVFASWHQPGLRMVRSADPAEKRNLAGVADAAEQKAALVAVLKNHLECTGDSFVLQKPRMQHFVFG